MVIKKNNRWSELHREMFYTELQALLIAGLDFSASFRLLIDGERDKRTARLLEKLYDEVVDGAALWQAMECSGAFRRLEYGVIRIGEETGQLPETLEFLGRYFHKRASRRKMLSSAVSYPLVILATAMVAVAFMLTVVVPMFAEVYTRMGRELPALTRSVVALSESFPAYTTAIAGAACIASVFLYFNRNRAAVRRVTSSMLMHLPVIGTIISKNLQVQFCHLICLLTSSGVPLLTAVGILREVIEFWPYEQSFERIARMLEQGEGFAASMARFPELYDRKLVALTRVGEETNRLPEMLKRQGDTLTEELEFNIKRMGALLEPLLILLVGILVAIVLISMYMPMFSLGSIIQ